jgi:hypothetical protein
VQTGDLLVEDLGENVHTNVELAGSLGELGVLAGELGVLALVKHDLGKDLVGERAGHDEGRVSGSTSQVDETALGKQDDVAAILHQEAVDLGLDGSAAGSVGLEPGNVNLAVEVTNVCAVG